MFPVTKISDSNSNVKQGIDTSDERKAFDSIDDDSKEKIEKKSGKEKNTEDDDNKEDNENDESGDKVEEGDDEEKLEENEEDEDEQKEDEEDEVTQDTVYQAVKAIDKNIFKKVPELKHVIFREQEYTKLFPTIEDASEAREQVDTFNEYQTDLMSGKSDKLLEALEKTDKKALEGFVSNFIPTLQKQSNELYLQMIFPEIKKLCRAALRSSDENLQNSAAHIHNWVFGDTDFKADVGLKPKEKSEEEDHLSKRERDFEEKRYNSFANDVFSNGVGRLERLVGFAFKDTDISPLLQKSLTKEIIARVDDAIKKDVRHMGNMNHLWEQAKRNGFTSEWKDRIINTYLSRAKLLIPSKRQAVLSEAKLSAKVGNGEEKKRPTRIPSSTTSSTMPKNKIDAKNIDWDKVNDERAMLEGKVPMKK